MTKKIEIKATDNVKPMNAATKQKFEWEKLKKQYKGIFETLWLVTVLITVLISVFSRLTVTECVQTQLFSIKGYNVTAGAVLASVLLSDIVVRMWNRLTEIHKR